jgi:hypothetical protein
MVLMKPNNKFDASAPVLIRASKGRRLLARARMIQTSATTESGFLYESYWPRNGSRANRERSGWPLLILPGRSLPVRRLRAVPRASLPFVVLALSLTLALLPGFSAERQNQDGHQPRVPESRGARIKREHTCWTADATRIADWTA